MSVLPVEGNVQLPRTSRLFTGTVIARFTGRRVVRSGIGWGLVFGLYVATQALAYSTSYKTIAARRLLMQEFGSNVGISAIVGPALRIDTVPGFTAWKCLTVLAITGAVWGILTSTKLTRGEEDAGRWELLLTGNATRRGSAVQALGAFAAGLCALLITTAAISIVVGHSSKVRISASGAIYFAIAIVAGAAMFLTLGALCAQLSSTRRQAAGVASALLGASYALRMVADSGSSLAWLRWATPLGWVEEMKPLTTPNPFALIPILVTVVVFGAMTVYLAGRRDIGSSVLPDRPSSKPRLHFLNGPLGLELRLTRSTLLAWAASIIAYGLILGSIAKSGGKIITSSPSLRLVFARLGVTGAQAYLGFAILIMAVALSFVASGMISAARSEESSGQLDSLLARPLSRVSWLGGRILQAVGTLVIGGIFVGLSTWVGAASAHAGVSFSSMLGAGLNTLPPALLLLGLGAMVFGLVPRWAVASTYAILVWSLLVEITGGIVNVNHWILDTSGFHQMTPAPSMPIDWTTNGVMIALGIVTASIGVAAFRRRDLKGE